MNISWRRSTWRTIQQSKKSWSRPCSSFRKKGFDAVSVEQIASAVGTKAPSLYKHCKSKQAIFDGIFAEMQHRYDQQTEKMQLHMADADRDDDLFSGISAQALYACVAALVSHSLHDPLLAGI